MATMQPDSDEAKAAFAHELVNPDAVLPAAIDWIKSHLSPGDVFDREQLSAWAVTAGHPPIPTED